MRAYTRSSKRRFAVFTASCLLVSSMLAAPPAAAAIDVNSDPVLYWNDIAIRNAVALSPGGAPAQARVYAMVNIAMHDAVNATRGGIDKSYLSGVANAGGDSRAAATQAAHDVLVKLNPANTSVYDSALANSLALITDSVAKTNGIATGRAYALAIDANRLGDRSGIAGAYTPPGQPDLNPGAYQLTPGVSAAVLPAWGNVKPFVISSVNDFVVAPPPALSSGDYAAAYNEVKDIVNALRPATGLTPEQQDQKNSALFWDVSNGGTWIRVALTIAEDEGLDTLGFAQVFATLSSGLADAAIAVWDAKYDNAFWRPITAIQNGEFDGNPMTIGDVSWTSLFNAPGHPSYVSAHSGLSATASAILRSYFGDDEAFSFSIGPDTRSFTSISQAELDAANSRLWGGIHFRFDNEAGLQLGREVGARVLSINPFGTVPESSTWAMMIAGFGAVGLSMRRRRLGVRALV
jgi:PAP2 superfamily